MIDICFAIHNKNGKYIKYLATAMCSIMENTKYKLRFHILHDKLLQKKHKRYLNSLVNSYQNRILFYNLYRVNFNLKETIIGRFSIGTLFRLYIADVLPKILDKVLYLDSDIVVNIDIDHLWKLNINNYSIAGCIDSVADKKYTGEVLKIDKYINAGVLIFNLEQIRNTIDLVDESMKFFQVHSNAKYLDQDAINSIFKGTVYFLDEKFNIPTVYVRNNNMEIEGIYHFIADVPRDLQQSFPDKLFFKYLQKTPWGKSDIVFKHYENRLIEKDKQIQIVYKMLQRVYISKKRIFWGVRGAIHPLIMQYFEVKNDDYYVDSNPNFWGKLYNNKIVWSPKKILEENKNEIVVITTIFKFNEVANKLKSYDLVENENFFNGKLLLPETITYKVYGELENKWDI